MDTPRRSNERALSLSKGVTIIASEQLIHDRRPGIQ